MRPHRLEGSQFPYTLTDVAFERAKLLAARAAMRSFVVPASPEGYRFTFIPGPDAGPLPFETASLQLAEDLARGAARPLFLIEYGPAPEKAPQ